ncbi:MAG: T9SS type A sorting domain-containing protein [Flavobacteriales bacterium]|nr:T9SS type A sorting domain-containing protein [Flavobacteriales bacterium]
MNWLDSTGHHINIYELYLVDHINLNAMRHTIKVLIIASIACLCSINLFAQSFDYGAMIERIQDELRTTNNGNIYKTDTWVDSMNVDGSWNDMPYGQNISSSDNTHLDRLVTIAQYATSPSHPKYGDSTYLDAVKFGLNYWVGSNSLSLANGEWWFVRLYWPQRVGMILTLMREFPGYTNQGTLAISEDEVYTTVLDDQVSKLDFWGLGANMMDVGLHYIYRGILEEDSVQLMAVSAYLESNMSSNIRSDYSFHEHGAQMHINSYAGVFANVTIKLAHYLAGSPAEFDKSSGNFNDLVSMIKYYQINSTRGHYCDFSGLGRGIAGIGFAKAWFVNYPLEKLAETIDTANADYYLGIIERNNGNKPPSYLSYPYNMHYWESDYAQHVRPEFYFSVRNVSTRTRSTEMAGDAQNLKGNFLSNGATNILVDGDEYKEVHVLWDWSMIPGTTIPYVETLPAMPQGGVVAGKTTFVGGVSSNNYGVTAYDNLKKVRANKAWFMFDEEVVCLGSFVAGAASDVRTTINQCNGEDSVYYSLDGVNEIAVGVADIVIMSNSFRWVRHDKVTYHFPDNDTIKFTLKEQSGTYYSINAGAGSTDTVYGDVFTLWQHHGDAPKKQTYAYILAPNDTSLAQAQNYLLDSINIVTNTDSIQVVYHRTLNIYQAVFYREGTFSHNGISITVDKPCVVMLQNDSLLSISDPTQTESELYIVVNKAGKAYSDNLALPTEGMKGSTLSVSLNDMSITSVEETTVIATGLRVYPNPVTDNFTIVLNQTEESVTVSIYDITGRLISQNAYSNTNKINLSGKVLAKGINLVKVETSTQNFTAKLIKE